MYEIIACIPNTWAFRMRVIFLNRMIFIGCSCQSVTPHGITLILLLIHEHNRVADKLRKMNPHWDGQTVFEESRRVIIAEIQHITYTQYLPLLLGEISYPVSLNR